MASEDTGEGVRLLLTPVQLAAALQGKTITEPEGWWGRLANRAEGGVTLFAGGLELVGAAGCFAVPDPSLLTKVAGWGLAIHGSDTTATGMRELWTGTHQTSMTQESVAAAARAMGFDPTRSDEFGLNVDILVPMVLLGPFGAGRAASVNAGRFVIEGEMGWRPGSRTRFVNVYEEDALGGHTFERHIGRNEAWLRKRSMDPKFTGAAASSFRSLEEAEKFIGRGLITKSAEITKWASSAAAGARADFIFVAGETVGYGVVKATNLYTPMSKLIIRLEKTAEQSKIYFVLTAFPSL